MAADNLREAMSLDENLKGEILVLKDTLGIGPISLEKMDETRTQFWRAITTNEEILVEDEKHVDEIIRKALEEEEPLCFWMAPCVSDVCAYYFLLHKCQQYPSLLYIINIDSLPFFNKDGQIFYPKNFSEVLPKEFIKTKRLLKEISSADYETEADFWNDLVNENAQVRLHKGGKELISKNETAFDEVLFSFINKEAQKGSKIVRQALGKINQSLSDQYLYWRLKEMTKMGQIHCNEEIIIDVAKAEFFIKSETENDTEVVGA